MSTEINERPHGVGELPNPAAVFAAVVFAAGLSAVVLETTATSASAAPIGFQQCNAHDKPYVTGAPLSVTCSITITNNVDASGGSAVTVVSRACENDDCTGDVVTGNLINAVHQCNGSDNVGGSTMVCDVHIINNITLDSPSAATALTLNQCIGSGGGGGTLMTGASRVRVVTQPSTSATVPVTAAMVR